jgi:hypothetical protein
MEVRAVEAGKACVTQLAAAPPNVVTRLGHWLVVIVPLNTPLLYVRLRAT